MADQGAGKSTLCSEYYSYLLSSFETSGDVPAPIFLDLEFVGLDRIQSLAGKLLGALSDEPSDKVAAVLILDSFDQAENRMGVAKYVASVLGRNQKLSAVVFSRDIPDASLFTPLLKELRIEPLKDEELKELLHEVSKGEITSDEFESLVQAGLIEGIRNPFWATMFALVVRKTGDVDVKTDDKSAYRLIRELERLNNKTPVDAVGIHANTVEYELARAVFHGRKTLTESKRDRHNDWNSPFVYLNGSEIRFRHDIFRDYFVTKYAAEELSVLRLMAYFYRDRRNENLAFSVFALTKEKGQKVRRWLQFISEYSIKKSGILLGHYNPFLYLYIKLIGSLPKGGERDNFVDRIVGLMIADSNQFPFAYYLPAEIRGPHYADFRLQNSHLVVSQLGSEKYRDYLFMKNAECVDRYSVFGFLGYRDIKSARFLVDVFDRTQKARSDHRFFDVTGLFYATSVITRFPFKLFPGLLYDEVKKEALCVHAVLDGILHLLARHRPEASNSAHQMEFDDESYLRVTQSSEWLDFFFFCFSEGDDKLSQTALGCLKNHNWSGPLRKDIEARLLKLCDDHRNEVRARAVHATLWFRDSFDVVERVLRDDSDMMARLKALHVAWITHKALFYEHGTDILFANSISGCLAEDKAERLAEHARQLAEGIGLNENQEELLEFFKCLAISVNAPTDKMRGWGIDLMGKLSGELATKVGEWIILNVEETSEDQHIGIFRAIRNIDSSINGVVVQKGLSSGNMGVVGIAIDCVDAENFTKDIEAALVEVRERIPNSYGHLREIVDRKIKNGGRK